jgi:hypothetical protein
MIWVRLAGVAVIISISVTSYLIQATLFPSDHIQKGYIKAKSWIDCISGALLILLGIRLVFRSICSLKLLSSGGSELPSGSRRSMVRSWYRMLPGREAGGFQQ